MKKVIFIILCFLMVSCSTTKNTINDVEFSIVDEINSDLKDTFGDNIYLLGNNDSIRVIENNYVKF